MHKLAALVAVGLSALLMKPAVGQPGTKTQIDLKARIRGTSEWLDVLNFTAAAIPDTVDIEVGVFCFRNAGYGLGVTVHSVYVSGWLPADVVTLLDRPDSPSHPDGRLGTFNLLPQSQAAFTTGIDAGRLRIAATGNTTDAVGGGVLVKQDTPATLGAAFNTADGVQVFQFEIALKNPSPNSAVPRTLVCDVPTDRVNSYAVYQTATSNGPASIRSSLVAADVATINVIWPACFVLESPSDAAVCPFAPAQFTVTPEGDGPYTYQWQIKGGPITAWTDLTEGANSSGGKFVLNSFGVKSASLLVDRGLDRWNAGVAGQFRCFVKKDCGSAYSTPAKLSICGADLNCDGFVTADDFDFYTQAFEAGDITSDYNNDGFVTGDDFDGFVAAFESGC